MPTKPGAEIRDTRRIVRNAHALATLSPNLLDRISREAI
jgi:hypothetical protein